MRLVKIFAVLVLVGVVSFLAFLWIDHTRETILPTPGGKFAVGQTSFIWNDSREDPLAPPGTKRELFAWVWYPTDPPAPPPASEYMPSAWRNALDQQRGFLLTHFVIRDLSKVRAHGVRDAALASKRPVYPVVLMRGGHSALTADYTCLAEDLASHGYIVVGIDAPYRTLVTVRPNGQVIARSPRNNAEAVSGQEQQQRAEKLVKAWAADMSFALDRLQELNVSDPTGKFRGRLNLEKVGAFGHSLGGAEALQFCHDDSRCTAGADVDGAPLGNVLSDGVKQPFFFLLSDHSREPEAETGPVKGGIRSIYDRLPADQRLEVIIHGANHYNFSDGGVLRTPFLMRVLRKLHVIPLEGRRQVGVSAHLITTFFDVYLRGAPASRLEDRPDFSEAKVVH